MIALIYFIVRYAHSFYSDKAVTLMQNHFDLFNLTPTFNVDMGQLDSAYREVQARVHPDKFVSSGSAEQRVAMQWATRANEAYQTLKKPLSRAIYLCELNGVSLNAESNTAMPRDFLMQQMELREELDDARNNEEALLHLEERLKQTQREQLQQISAQLTTPDYQEAAQLLRQLMFLEKISHDIANALE